MSTTEEEGQAIITVLAMGDLSSDFSIIVMAINETAVGKLFHQNHSRVEIRTTSAVPHAACVNYFTVIYSMYITVVR